jgi:molybdopterin/thiamine biosynthesis adenylyltransferase
MLAEKGESRTLAQMEVMAELDGDQPLAHSTVELSLVPGAGASRRLLATALLDYLLRLDPLVSEVRVEGFEHVVIEELATRLPLEQRSSPASAPADLAIAIGAGGGDCDLRLDAGGWVASVGASIDFDEERVLNPIGPLAAACLGSAEAFKDLFEMSFPAAPVAARFRPGTGTFCFYDYSADGTGPALDDLEIDASLLGLGGVGAGVVRALAVLGPHLHGLLRLIDHDRLDVHSLNRVTYATVHQATERSPKVACANTFLRAACPDLDVVPHPEDFDQFKRNLAPRRAERRYEVLITALDSDEIRHAAQRELPRVLIDGSTGRDLNMRIERVQLGEWGCLGCTRQAPAPTVERDDGCGSFADPRAPSVSFLAALPGILAAAELIKETMGDGDAGLRGEFQHVFLAAPNTDMRSEPARRQDCRCRCFDAGVLQAYAQKYARC